MKAKKEITTLVLGLEGTLVSLGTYVPRPWLHPFLVGCEQLFLQVIISGNVPESRFRHIADGLIGDFYAPDSLKTLDYFQRGDRTRLDPQETIFVSDSGAGAYESESQWIQIKSYDPNKNNKYIDEELKKMLKILCLEKYAVKSYQASEDEYIRISRIPRPARDIFRGWAADNAIWPLSGKKQDETNIIDYLRWVLVGANPSLIEVLL